MRVQDDRPCRLERERSRRTSASRNEIGVHETPSYENRLSRFEAKDDGVGVHRRRKDGTPCLRGDLTQGTGLRLPFDLRGRGR